jgi:predicted glutamine amidotransferase
MLTLLGDPKAVKKYQGELIDSLIKSAERDPYLELRGVRPPSHGDGWGYVVIDVYDRDLISVSEYRSLRPIFEDPVARESYLDDSARKVVEVFHARKSSVGMARNIFSVHPIGLYTRAGLRLYVAHNGTLNKASLAKLLSLGPEDPFTKRCSDTCLLAEYLARNLGEALDISLLEEVKKYTVSALNLILVLLAEDRVEVVYGSYYKKNEEYYRLYVAEADNFLAVASSTLIDYYRPRVPLEWFQLGNGEYRKVEIEVK